MLSGAPPRYPRESRRHREEGTVVLALTLDVDGSVASISVAQSSGFQRLDEAALRAVRKWRWAPTMRSGQAVKVKGLVEIPFVLRGKSAD
nr:energy transducer TonB [Sphingopyxis panaciterrulae]